MRHLEHAHHSQLRRDYDRPFPLPFFALYEDYNDYGRSFVQEFNNVYLQRLARDLRDQGAVIQPFLADIETTRSHVLAKDWTDDERREITRAPSLLVISKDFDYFSPRSDPWLLLHFGERRYGGPEGLAELDETIRSITEAATKVDAEPGELYRVAREVTKERPDLALAFSVQFGIFGVSIDIIQAGRYFRTLLRNRKPIGRQSEDENRRTSRPFRP